MEGRESKALKTESIANIQTDRQTDMSELSQKSYNYHATYV